MLNYLPDLVGRGVVQRFYMSHKPSTARSLELPSEVVRNFPAKEYLLRGYGMAFKTWNQDAAIVAFHRLWENQVLRDWKPSEQLHLLAQGATVRIGKRARAEGSRVLCEVVNTHPEHRLRLMQLEAKRWGLKAWRPSLLRREKLILEEVAQADALLAPTQHVANSFRQSGFTKPIHILPYAANVERFEPLEGPEKRLRHGPLRIISVGQIGLRKGQLHLLEVVSRLNFDIEITLVGDIDPEVIELLARHYQRFKHVARVAPPEMPKLLANHDIFVSASLEEGLAVSVCEAMAMGLAVIATRESGASEVMDDGVHGLLFDATDQEALAEKIACLNDDRDMLSQISAAAFMRTRLLVNWRTYADGLEHIYGTR
tara:strand:- start:136 stop:1248 length:1113 start_codon:yes stop_codon:yes gene_type:complete